VPPHCFSLRTELARKRNTPYLPFISRWRNIGFMENWHILLNWRDKCIYCENTSMLEDEMSYTLFPFENWGSLSKDYSLSVSVHKWGNILFMENRPIRMNWRYTCIPLKNTI
jgi:hypothetical protein